MARLHDRRVACTVLRFRQARDFNLIEPRSTPCKPLWDTYSKLGAMSELDRVALNELTAYVRGPGPAAVRSSVRKEQLIIPPAGNSDRTKYVPNSVPAALGEQVA